jgi:hypothetical protein
MEQIPLVVEFAPGSRVEAVEAAPEADPRTSPDTLPKDALIRFADGTEVPVPADQIVLEEQGRDSARVGFGGVSFEGMVEGQLAFWRVKDIAPEEALAPDREIRFLIDPRRVSSVLVRGTQVWPKKAESA